jgi:ribA/ribD-fused uncharacterized protein
MNNDCLFFWGGIYSQWYKSEIRDDMMFPGISFNCNEQYMMYSKAMLFKDEEVANKILSKSNPRDQKALGRTVKNFDQKIWNKKKMTIVVRANYLKFTQNNDLYEQMIRDKDKFLVEASPEDSIWGIGLSEKDAKITPRKEWPGENLLGKAIMEARNIIIKSK